MSVLEETISVAKRTGDEVSAANLDRWRRRIVLPLIATGLLVVLAIGVQRSSLLDAGQMLQDDSGTQTARTESPATFSETFTDMNPASAVDSLPDTTQSGNTAESDPTPEDDASTPSVRSVSAVAGVEGVELYEIPGGAILSSVPTGTRLAISGQNDDGSWLYVSAGSGTGWAPSTDVIGFNLDSLPVLAVQDASPDTGSAQEVEQSDGDLALVDYTEEATVSGAADAGGMSASPSAETEPVSAVATVSLDEGRLNIRSGPGTAYEIIGKAYPDEEYIALGRDDSGEWILVLLSGDDAGWVSARYVNLSGPDTSLPIASAIEQSDSSLRMETAGQLPAQDGTGETSTAKTAVSEPTVAVDGSGLTGTIVFEGSNGGTIYATDLETGLTTVLTRGADPAISPDGSTVAFVRDGGENGLYLVDIDGSNERLIWSGRSGLSSPSWSPDGSWIVFSFRGSYHECWQIGPMCVPENPGFDDAELVRTYNYNLAVVDVNGESYHEPPSLNSAVAADWNDAGIVYQSDSGIQLTSDEAGGVNQLVSFDYLKPTYQDPALQPDGDLVVFQSREASHYEIFTMNVDGSNIQALTRPETTLVDEMPSNVSPAWSPDGQSILFLSNRTDDGSAGNWHIWVMDADGNNQRPLGIDVSIEYAYGAEQVISWGV